MANDKDIKIGIDTTANTSGIDKAQAKLKELETQSTGFGGMLDASPERIDQLAKLETAQDKVTASIEKEAPALKKVREEVEKITPAAEAAGKKMADIGVKDSESNLRGRALAWAKIGEALNMYGAAATRAMGDMEGLDGETKQLIKTASEGAEKVGGLISAVAQGFAAGGPLGAITAGTAAGVGELFKAIIQTVGALAASDKAVERSVATFKKLQDLKGKLPLLDAMEAVNKQLDLELEKLVRNARVRESGRSLEQTQVEVAGKAAVVSGAQTQEVAAAQALVSQVRSQQEKIREDLAIAAQAQEDTQSDANFLKANAEAGVITEGFQTLDDMFVAAKQKQSEATAAFKTLEDDRAIAANKLTELATSAGESFREIGAAATNSQTQAAQDALAAALQKSAELGGNISSNFQTLINDLTTVLADGVVKVNESPLVVDAINRMAGSVEAKDERVITAMDRLVLTNESIMKRLPDLERRIAAIETSAQQ